MVVVVMHDFNPSRFYQNWQSVGKAFFLSPMWFLHRSDAYKRLKSIADGGGLKEFYSLRNDQLVEYGADRTLFRYPLDHLQEAVALGPDIIVAFDFALSSVDSEQDLMQKLVANENIVVEYDRWLQEHRIRKNFKLLGVVHGVTPDDYAEQTRHMIKHVNIVGVPSGAYILKRQYSTLLKIIEAVRNEIPNDRYVGDVKEERPTLQLMGYGASNLEQLKATIEMANKSGIDLILEGSTVMRESQNRRVLAVNRKSGDIRYETIQRVRNPDARRWTPYECYTYNAHTLDGLIEEMQGSLKLM